MIFPSEFSCLFFIPLLPSFLFSLICRLALSFYSFSSFSSLPFCPHTWLRWVPFSDGSIRCYRRGGREATERARRGAVRPGRPFRAGRARAKRPCRHGTSSAFTRVLGCDARTPRERSDLSRARGARRRARGAPPEREPGRLLRAGRVGPARAWGSPRCEWAAKGGVPTRRSRSEA